MSPNAPDTPLGAAVVADAADLVARALRAHERAGAFAGLAPHVVAELRRAARVLEACAAEARERTMEVQRVRLYSRAMGDLIDDAQERLL